MSERTNSVDLPLIIGVTTRAMFDLAEEHSVFEEQGVERMRYCSESAKMTR